MQIEHNNTSRSFSTIHCRPGLPILVQVHVLSAHTMDHMSNAQLCLSPTACCADKASLKVLDPFPSDIIQAGVHCVHRCCARHCTHRLLPELRLQQSHHWVTHKGQWVVWSRVGEDVVPAAVAHSMHSWNVTVNTPND